MSIFREHKTIADRAAGDRSRHRQKIEKAIKESIKDVVAEESIIGQSGKKKIRIPVRSILRIPERGRSGARVILRC